MNGTKPSDTATARKRVGNPLDSNYLTARYAAPPIVPQRKPTTMCSGCVLIPFSYKIARRQTFSLISFLQTPIWNDVASPESP